MPTAAGAGTPQVSPPRSRPAGSRESRPPADPAATICPGAEIPHAAFTGKKAKYTSQTAGPGPDRSTSSRPTPATAPRPAEQRERRHLPTIRPSETPRPDGQPALRPAQPPAKHSETHLASGPCHDGDLIRGSRFRRRTLVTFILCLTRLRRPLSYQHHGGNGWPSPGGYQSYGSRGLTIDRIYESLRWKPDGDGASACSLAKGT